MYVADCQIWLRQPAVLSRRRAGVVVVLREPAAQAGVPQGRAARLFFGNTPEPIAPLGKGGGRLDRQRWNLPQVGGGVLAAAREADVGAREPALGPRGRKVRRVDDQP
eukprot:6143200-Prymnesium_polylepis.1